MKDPISVRLEEVRELTVKISLFAVVLNSILVFLVSAIVLRVLGITAIIALCPMAIYAILNIIYSIHKINAITSVVKNYPSLDERLQTAYDNRGESNIIVESLIKEVDNRMKKIRYSPFLDTQKVLSRTIFSVILIFIFLSINFINIEDLNLDLHKYVGADIIDQIEDFTGFDISQNNNFQVSKDEEFETKNKVEDDLIGGDIGGETPGVSEGPISGSGGGTGEKADDDIYGDMSCAEIAGKNMGMEMHPEYGGEITIKDISEERAQEVFSDNLKGKSAEIPEQDPVEYRELIKKYFQSLQKISQE